MKSNFQFLNNYGLTIQYYNRAIQAEISYAMGIYPSVLTAVRTIAENMARDVADKRHLKIDTRETFDNILKRLKLGHYVDDYALELFYDIKKSGNLAAHTLETNSKVKALKALKQLFTLMVWFVGTLYNEKIDVTSFREPTKSEYLYQTTIQRANSEKNIIYIQTADNSSGKFKVYEGNQKVGKTGVGDLAEDNSDNSSYLRVWAKKRINQYMKTSGVPAKLEWAELAYRKSDGWWFSDYDVHNVLERSGVKHSQDLAGNEWFETDLETAKSAIKAVKSGKDSLDNLVTRDKTKIVLRPEQKKAIEKTKANFKLSKKMLWNAKMRFGKTLTALELIKEEEYKKVLIMTHRPVVDNGWYADFNKIGMHDFGYIYGSKKQGHKSIKDLENSGNPYVYFTSIQDLGGSEIIGGKVSDKNKDLFEVNWDLVIVDEAHEGTQTELTKNILKSILKEQTKELDLSGTPFNILSDYDEDQVFTWDYTMEQEAKNNWFKEHPKVRNPYEGLPKVSMFTFEMNKHFKDPRFVGSGYDKYAFNFKEFFKITDKGKFVYENDVKRFLDNITNPGHTNYPFSTREFRNRLRHTLWVLPGIKEANALEDMLKAHPVFGSEYNILNVVKHDKYDNELGTENDVEVENKAIRQADKDGKKTITLTVRKLTTGATIPEWTGVLFLSNTSSTMQYLQTAFRAQTPFSSPEFGKKENCYIFDFAPDRALTVMAESTSLATGVGKVQTKEQKHRMAKLMNFLPIIGESNQKMKPFKVDNLLSKIKRVYAERAYSQGFDDDSIYSDQLLMIKDADISDFNNLKSIIGTTKKEKSKLKKIDVNNQGLTESEYDLGEKARKKRHRERSPEEQNAINKVNQLKKQRRKLISILRGISIRIPMMIYGMDIKFDEEVSIHKFIKNIDDVSWTEFMPEGVSKELFNKFIKYYDADVFIEAGKIIRRKVKELDKSDPLERVEKIADIFRTFRNPDKETVLTPWRVVNMHLGKTIGGLSFYDDDYQYSYKNGRVIRHWICTDYTNQTLSSNSHVLEINSKTGLYPLYVATSIYWQEFQKLNYRTAGKFNYKDELLLWQRVLKENIFLVAKTPMAREITRRTLAGYHTDWNINVKYVENMVNDAKTNINKEAKKIEELFGNMKFDIVIGNPPFQQSAAKKVTNGQQRVLNIFQYFQELADKLDLDYSSLIFPGKRWIHRSGKGMSSFGLDLINDPHLSKLIYFEDASQIFKNVDIADGVCIVFKDYNKVSDTFDYEFVDKFGNVQNVNIKYPGKRLLILNPKEMTIGNKIADYVEKNNLKFISDSPVINQKLFKIESKFVEDHPDEVRVLKSENSKIDENKEIKLFTNDKAGKAGRATWFAAKKDVIKANRSLINEWQVVVSSANAGGQKRDNQIQIIDNHSAFGRSRIALKSFCTLKEAKNFLKYAQSNFIRFTFLLTDEQLSSLGKYVPDILDYTDNNELINFNDCIDSQLFDIFNLNEKERHHINKVIEELDKKYGK